MTLWVRRSGIQLAYPFEEKRLAKWEPPYIIQPKLDGDRCRAVFDDFGQVKLLSSEEHELPTIPFIKQELESLGLKNLELDGENYIHGRPQAEVHGIVSSQRVGLHEDHHKVEYHLFDLIDEYTPQWKRLLALHNLYIERLSPLSHIKIIPFYIIHTLEEVYSCLNVFMSQGFEGFILRKYSEVYRRKRSIYMMKFKPKKRDVYQIIGIKEAISKDKVPKGMVGSFLCVSPPKPEVFPIGAGRLTHEQRIAYWEIRNDLPGQYLLVEYQHLTSKNGVPRSGVAVKVITKEEIEEED